LPRRLRFGRHELRPDERALWIDGRVVPLGARAFDVLMALAERRDRVVSKSELLDIAWPGLIVEENNLSVQISALRKVLGTHAIATVPALGYRFALGEDDEPGSSGSAGVAGSSATPGRVDLATVPQRESAGLLPWEEVAATRSGVLRTGAAWLVVKRIAIDKIKDADFDSQLRLLAGPQIAAHGGQVHASTGYRLVASFSRPSAACACGHKLLETARTVSGARGGIAPAPWQLGVGVADDGHPDPSGVAEHLATRARPGEVLVAAEVADRLIPNLDGELHDLGVHDAPDADATTRAFRLTPSNPPAMGGPPVTQHDNLRPTVALIPFSPYMRGDVPLVALGDVISDQVIGALSRSRSINVISRLSTIAFRDREMTVQQIARPLASDFVVSGRYWVSSGRVTVHVELAEAATARVLWTHTVVDDERAALHPDSNLVLDLVAGIVQAVFAHEVSGLRSRSLPDLASHTLLLAAISLLYRLSPRDFALARSALETLHERAPRHAAPLAWLARWHLFRVVQGWTENRDEDGRKALEHANHALDIDPDSSLALTMLGNVHTNYLRDLDRAEILYDQALAINPNESLAWLQKGNALSFAGQGEAALAHTRNALRLSPLDPSRHFYLSLQAAAALTARDWGQAIDSARQSLKLNQEHVSTHRTLAIALALSGQLDEARNSVRRVLRLEPGLTVAGFVARSPGARSGLAEEFGRALLAAGLPAGGAGIN